MTTEIRQISERIRILNCQLMTARGQITECSDPAGKNRECGVLRSDIRYLQRLKKKLRASS